jgi:transcriptional regulator NrdR family protein
MNCIYCNSRTSVIDTRTRKNGLNVRERKCSVCLERFKTIETVYVRAGTVNLNREEFWRMDQQGLINWKGKEPTAIIDGVRVEVTKN